MAETLTHYLQRPRPSFASWKDPVPAYVLGPPIVGSILVGGGLWDLVRLQSVAYSLGELAVGVLLLACFALYVMRPVGPSWWAEDADQ